MTFAVSLDIGGSLAKCVMYSVTDGTESITCCFETVEELDNLLKHASSFLDLHFAKSERTIYATGGGSHKFASSIETACRAKIVLCDEMESLVAGASWLFAVDHEVFSIDLMTGMKLVFPPSEQRDHFPFLLVNIGSGVSIIHVERDGYKRITGSSIGGGTFRGLMQLLGGGSSFSEMLAHACRGDSRSVDLLVGDIYGQAYSKIGLDKEIIASSFGKVRNGYISPNIDDMARGLLEMVTNNIGHLASLSAELKGTRFVIFSGFFIRGQGN